MSLSAVINVEDDLQACGICGRTFLPVSLTKHSRVCERNATRRRKVFDSLKQRVEGTELAPFHQRTYLKRTNSNSTPEINRKSSKWREKHLELVNTIRAARGLPSEMPGSPKRTISNATAGSERCPSCDRQFGPRAYDRHVEWCKERKARIHRSPAEVLLAKERLDARIKYKVPLPNKSKRVLIRDKYSPTIGSRTESVISVKSSCTNLDRSPSIRKPKSVNNLRKVHEIKVEHEMPIEMMRDCFDGGDVKPLVREKSVPKELKIPIVEGVKIVNQQSDYNPFVTAERQLMELLECDDFKPFFGKKLSASVQSIPQRPHTTDNTKPSPRTETHNKHKIIKSAENNTRKTPLARKSSTNTKRSSVIDPPMDFQDKMNNLDDDFELIESLINQNYIEGYDVNGGELNFDAISNKIAKNFFLEPNANEFGGKGRKYSDELSIDPRLINENDNLSIPENLKADNYSSNSSIDNNVTPLISSLHKDSYIKSKRDEKTDDKPKSVSNVKNTNVTNANKKSSLKSVAKTKNVVHKSPVASLTSSFGSTNKNNLNADKKKTTLSSLKRSVSLVDSVKPKNLKNKQDVQNYFNEQDKKNINDKTERISPDRQSKKGVSPTPTAEELFSVDDEMYEEYKKYEEMYLREKQQQKIQNEGGDNKKKVAPVEDFASSGTLTPNEVGENVPANKVSADSAYSSLNRKTPKIRARSTKLAPLDCQGSNSSPVGSPTSSGSEMSPTFLKNHLSASQRMSKFCHECGNRYPINTAKFCVECGVKRLVL